MTAVDLGFIIDLTHFCLIILRDNLPIVKSLKQLWQKMVNSWSGWLLAEILDLTSLGWRSWSPVLENLLTLQVSFNNFVIIFNGNTCSLTPNQVRLNSQEYLFYFVFVRKCWPYTPTNSPPPSATVLGIFGSRPVGQLLTVFIKPYKIVFWN